MKKVLVVFGSVSDSEVYDRVAAELKSLGVDFDLRICSAHRTPDMLDEILKGDKAPKYDMIIAGAGLAAHLPGVIASKTIAPVIGIPCKGALGGLDAFLSIVQMPPGYPVLCSGPGEIPSRFLRKMLDLEPWAVNVCGEIADKSVGKCTEMLTRFGADYSLSTDPSPDMLNIHFYDAGKPNEESMGRPDPGSINVPLIKDSKPADALRLMDTDSCVSVGINRGDNAAIAAIQLMDTGRYTQKLDAFRSEMKEKVIEDDRRINSQGTAGKDA